MLKVREKVKKKEKTKIANDDDFLYFFEKKERQHRLLSMLGVIIRLVEGYHNGQKKIVVEKNS